MRSLAKPLAIVLVCVLLVTPCAAAKPVGPIPPSITTPDKVESRTGTLEFTDGMPSQETLDEVYDNLDFTHAFEAYVNALPGVSMQAMHQGFLDAGVKDNEALIFSELMDAKSLFLTANADTVYAGGFLDLSQGPMVLEVPPKFLGAINDYWFRWVIDLGGPGPDRGLGGKYLILPPGYDGPLPEGGFFTARAETTHVMWFGHMFLENNDLKPAVEQIRKFVKIYPYQAGGFGTSFAAFLRDEAQLGSITPPPETVFHNVSGKAMNTIPPNKQYFDGAKTYQLTLPKDIPTKNFWSLTVYDNQTRSMLDTPQRYPRAGSQNYPTPAAEPNADGSTTVYFAPEQPAGVARGNWIQTMPGKGWFVLLRLYGPLEPFFDKSWQPGEIEPADAATSSPSMPAESAAAEVPTASTARPTSSGAQSAGMLTPRELTAPGALAGPSPSSFNWSPVGAALAYVEPQDGQDMLWLYDAASGEKRLLLDPAGSERNIDVTSAQWSPDGARLLLTGDDALWLLEVASGDLTMLDKGGGAKTGITFTPDGSRVSFVQDNDLYAMDIDSGEIQRLTSDGGETIFNGALDWVYNEELATRAAQPAYAWSPDGAWLIYLRLDETNVSRDPVTDYRPVPATVSYTRYPTAGTTNPTATLHAQAQGALAPPLEVPLPAGTEYVLPFFTWTPDSNHALFITVNRDHTELILNRWTPQSGELRALITETAPDWINEDRYAAPIFIGDGSQFLWISERDGFMHLYLYTAEGELVRQLTQGDWMIDSSAYNLLTPGRPVHVDPEGSRAYFTTTRTSPLERQIDRVNIASGQIEQVSQQPGFHLAALSADGRYLVDQSSDVAAPPITTIVPTDEGDAEVLAQAAGPALDLPQMTREFLTIKAHDGTDLYAQLVKPEDFDPARQYPVVVHWYGGPGLQMVSNRYGTTNIFNIIERDVLYTQEGFLVWRLDNRGSLGRGHAFETPIFGELGKAALDDQLAGIEYLQTLPYVDATRIGTDGKSFGGYMTLYALLHAPEVFRCGVAGAAPTDWSTYDTIYTERYMRTPDANPEGYAATNLIDMAGQIEARSLLIHGLADTNVHLQNTVNFIQALQENDKLFDFIPLPTLSHSFRGDGLVAALAASLDYFDRCLASESGEARNTALAPSAIANPASEHCVEQGGMLTIEVGSSGGQYGVCTFEDNMQCEEWALLRGQCPPGGVKVTGYVTPAGRYCAIAGGSYAITANSGASDEQGTCTLPDGGQCDAWDYYNGLCDASTAAPAEPASAMGASPAVTATAVSTATMVPLKDAMAAMEPQAVWQNFYDLTQVPRPSHHEEQVRDFLVQFGQRLDLETIVDDVGNVLIRKPAAPGLEDRQGVILQAHMDMVPQKRAESDHDFLLDPIDAYVDGEWIVADGTTLGADDGIGIAMAMAMLQEQDTPLGPIEALFTVNEEDGMDGALGLQPGLLQGSILINLDSEEIDVFTIGSAGGEYAEVTTTYTESPVPAGVTAFTLDVSGLQGGHSGVDIDKGRGHATKLLVRILKGASADHGLRLAQLEAGTAANAIPREASALLVVPMDQADAFLESVRDFEETVRTELAAVEPDLLVQAEPAELPVAVLAEEVQATLIDLLYANPQGVLRMSDGVPGLVETSTNMGIVNVADGQAEIAMLSRSSVDSELADASQMVDSVWNLAGVDVAFSGKYSGWNPDPESPILLLMQSVYKDLYGAEPAVTAVHAGLECGTVVSKYPGMDAISVGPTLQNVHSPGERLEIATVPQLYDFLLETLQRIPVLSLADSDQPSAIQETASAAEEAPTSAITVTKVITYVPELPTGEPQASSCWTNSLAVWRADAWRCFVGNSIYDPCFLANDSVICGASPMTTTVSFALELTEPLPAPSVPDDTTGHAWLVELPDGTVCEFATGATGGVGGERINYLCPRPDQNQQVVIVGDLQPGAIWMARRAVLTGSMPDLSVLEPAMVPVRTVWR